MLFVKEINNVVSVMKIKRYNICFFDSRDWYACRFMRSGAYPNLATCQVCLGADSMDYQKKFKPLVLVGTAALCWSI